MFDWILLATLFFSTTVLVYIVRRYALRHLLDMPNFRSSHLKPTPRGGGLACVLTYVLSVLFLYWQERVALPALGLTALAVAMAGIGFWDDHQPIAARWRLLAHLFAAAWAMYFLNGLPRISIPFGLGIMDLGGLGYVLGTLFLAWSLNLLNFMDGIDGIAAIETCFVSAGLAWFVWDFDTNIALFALCLVAVSAGFLVWNFPPAKIFMGDVGSSFLGFMLGGLILLVSHVQPVLGVVGLILYAVFVCDTSVTLLRRYFSGQNCAEAHCSHAYQLLVKRYPKHGHLRVDVVLMVINVAYLLPLAVLAFKQPDYAGTCLLGAYFPLILLVYCFKAGKQMI